MSFRYPKGGFIQYFFDPLTPGALQPTLYGWGSNNSSVLTTGTVYRSSPIQVGSPGQWSNFDAGGNAFLGVTPDGSLWARGNGEEGQLGNNSVGNLSTTTRIGSLTNWSKVFKSSETKFSVAVKTDGTLWSWGINNVGQLGQNNRTYRSSPVQVGGLTNWSTVSPSNGFCLAIKTDGTLWAWGGNGVGSLGLDDTVVRSSPVQVGALTNWLKISTGTSWSAAIKTDGTLWTWGKNQYGQLGHGNVIYKSSPTQVGALTNWLNVAAGGDHLIATKTDGTLWSCGYGSAGALGLNESGSPNKSSPVQIGTLTSWLTVAASGRSSFAIKTDKTLWAWGDSYAGQLGLNTVVDVSSPTQVGTLANWSAPCSAYYTTFVALDT